jgi:hypothetical protein
LAALQSARPARSQPMLRTMTRTARRRRPRIPCRGRMRGRGGMVQDRRLALCKAGRLPPKPCESILSQARCNTARATLYGACCMPYTSSPLAE